MPHLPVHVNTGLAATPLLPSRLVGGILRDRAAEADPLQHRLLVRLVPLVVRLLVRLLVRPEVRLVVRLLVRLVVRPVVRLVVRPVVRPVRPMVLQDVWAAEGS